MTIYIDSGGNFQYWVMSFTYLFAGGAIDELAQGFTTGDHPQGYRIDSASIRLNGPFDPNGFILRLFDGSSQPGRERFTFRNPPASPGNGPVTFQAPPAMKLMPNTTYYLRAAAKYEGVGLVHARGSRRGLVDAGSAAGWSIAGESHFRAPGYGWVIDTDRSTIIGINGRPIAEDAPPYVNGIDFSSTPAANGNYVAGEAISARVSFSEPVTASGSPVLPLTIGTATRNAAYQAMESTATELAFAYTVTAGDRDDDGVSIAADALSGTIRRQGAQTDAGPLGHGPVDDQRPHRVDGIPLVEEPVRVTSSPDAGTWYSSGERIEINVNLTDPVTVSGNPRFRFKLGNGPRNNEGRVIAAAYDAARSTTTSLVFSYTVQTTDADDNGFWIGDGTQTLLLDAADAVRDAGGRSADLNHCIVKTMANHKVHGGPWITGVAATSSPASGNVYRLGETIEITVTYDQVVTVSGDPEFEFSLGQSGDTEDESRRRATYDAGASSADSLVFTYVVAPGDLDPDGIWIGDHTRTLKLDGDDSIVNRHMVASRPDHREFGRLTAHKVDARPWITGVEVTSNPAIDIYYTPGETIEMTVTYDQEVTVDGDPEFEFSLGSPGAAAGTGDRRAAYDAGASSANSLVFTYTVLPTDEDPNGIWIGDHTRTLKLDTDDKIRNPHGSDARPQHPARNTLSGHKVDGDRNIATLSDLALEDRRAVGVSLGPAFASATTRYRAEVGRAVDRVTVAATPTNPNADLAWLDENDVALADADGSADGHQVDLDAGENVVKAKVTAVDGTTMETYVVTVTRRAPVNLAVIGLADTTVAENRTFASWVPALSGTSVGTVTWTKEGVDAADFTIDPSTGVLSMVVRDYEAPADANTDNGYEVTVKATDADDNSALVSITVTVTDEVETATLAITGLADVSVPENMPWTSPAPTLTGGPIGEVTWSVEGTDAADFTIDPSTGVLSMVARDYEAPADANTDNAYEVRVKATDADGNSAMVSIKVTVTDVKELAALSITGLADASVEENEPWASPVPTLTGTPIGEVT